MIDITIENFEADLIGASQQRPILLDIWAPWCGPCKQLGPVLESLETEYQGRFSLAKLNADEQPEIAGQLSQMFGVRSIPFCVMFVGGQPVDGFVGALPAEQIRGFLAKHVPSEGEVAAEAEVHEAEELAAEGQAGGAVDLLLDALEKDPNNDEARYDLIALMLAEGSDTALEHARLVAEPLRPRTTGPIVEARPAAFVRVLDAVIAVRAQGRPLSALQEAIAANKRDFAARYELASLHLTMGRKHEAMDELLEIIMRDKAWHDESPRKLYIAILETMGKPVPKPAAGRSAANPGPQGAADGKPKLEIAGKAEVPQGDPVIDAYRRKLSMALF
jgi:putative thioredoxin